MAGTGMGIFEPAIKWLVKPLLRSGRNVASGGRAFSATMGRRARQMMRDARFHAKPAAGRPLKSDPIDVASGEMVLTQADVQMSGVLPLVLSRTHLSSYRVGRSFGSAWASTVDQRLEVDEAGIVYVADDGMLLTYPPASPGGSAVLPVEGPRRPLLTTAGGGYRLADPHSRQTLTFASPDEDGVAALASISDPNGNHITFEYEADGSLARISHSGDHRLGVENVDGRITALWHESSESAEGSARTVLMRYGYDAAGNLVEVTDPSGRPLRFDYDTEGRIVGWVDRNGDWYRYTYDEHGRCVRTRGVDGCLDATFAYHDERTVHTDSLGHQTVFRLNELRQIVAETDPLGNASTHRWDHYDRLLAETDPLGRTATYSYDDGGNLTEVTREDGSLITAEYDHHGQLVRVTDAVGTTWRQAYDDGGNLVAVTDPAGATTTYTHDRRGRLTGLTDPLGNATRVETNQAGLPVAVTNPLGATTRCTRDAFGRVTELTDPVGGTTRFGWTVAGEPAWRTLPDGSTERWTYDAEGNLVDHVDPLGQTTRFEVSHFDLPSAEIAPDGSRLEYTYDTELRLTAVTNAQGLTWRYDYDAAGLLVRETDFDGRVLTYTYDAAGQLVERTNGAGQTTRYTRDALGNVVEQRFGDTIARFTYDRAERLIRAVNDDADVWFERDPLGRVVAESCNGRVIASDYDAAGRRAGRRTPSGAATTWEYDAADRPVAMRAAGRLMRFAYDAADRETTRLIGDRAVLTQQWDACHRLSAQTLRAPDVSEPPRQHRTYDYRADGTLTGIGDHLFGGRRFELDQQRRVTAVSAPGWTEHYAYDAAGNIADAGLPRSRPDLPRELIDSDGRREYAGARILRAGNIRYEHDAQGRIVLMQRKPPSSKPLTWRYTWNADDRLIAVATPDGSRWRYRYDPIGRRIAKQRLHSDSSILEQVDFTWDEGLLTEQTHTVWRDGLASSRVTTWEYEPDSLRPLSQTERALARDASQKQIDEQFYAIVTDLGGFPTEMLDFSGRLHLAQTSTLWGAVRSRGGDGAACPLRFPGQYQDLESGLYYNYHRYYNPATARYQSPDPLGLTPQPNPYAYVHNPTGWIDPFGLSPCRIPGRGFMRKKHKLSQAGAWISGRTSAMFRRLANTQPAPNATVRDLLSLNQGNRQYADKAGSAVSRSDDELMSSVFRPKDYQYMTVIPQDTSVIFEGNHRRFELIDRANNPNSRINWDTRIYIHRFKGSG
jgi:RHS repeat-associated protein